MIPFNQKINYIRFDRKTFEDGSRKYITPAGPLPSVTTILGSTGDKTVLEAWKKRVGESQAETIKKESTGLGTLMHAHLECYISGVNRPQGNNLVRKMAQEMADTIINRGLINVSEVWAIEQELYFPGLYAGTTDLIGVHSNSIFVGDFKTTNKIKKEEYILDYKLQLVAYAMAHNEVYDTSISKGVIFMVSRNNEYQEFKVSDSDFEKYRNIWLNRLEEYYSKN